MKRLILVLGGLICFVSLTIGCSASGRNSNSPPATPAITWPAPATIAYGTALSSTQIDASSNYPGTFTYSPASGAVLAAGTQTLTATSTPRDSAKAASATPTNTITVNRSKSIVNVTPGTSSITTATTEA